MIFLKSPASSRLPLNLKLFTQHLTAGVYQRQECVVFTIGDEAGSGGREESTPERQFSHNGKGYMAWPSPQAPHSDGDNTLNIPANTRVEFIFNIFFDQPSICKDAELFDISFTFFTVILSFHL